MKKLITGVSIFVLSVCGNLFAQEFGFTDLQIRGNPEIAVRSSADRYHILYEGDSLTNFPRRIAVFLGATDEARITLSPNPYSRTNEIVYYRVESYDGCVPGDIDGDGIDDFYELKQSYLDPLDGADAGLDNDGDTVSNFIEYRTVTDGDNSNEFLCVFATPLTEWAAPATEFPLPGMNQLDVVPTDISPFVPAQSGQRAGIARGALNTDLLLDVVAVDTNTHGVQVFLGEADDVLSAPASVPTGFLNPTFVSIAQFIGDSSPDLAVGHAGGEVTFLEGQGDGTFTLRNDLTTLGLGVIVGMTHTDFDKDGDEDLVVSGTDRVTLLRNDDSPLAETPITNGSFSNGLAAWTTEALGSAPPAVAGSVSAQNNQAFLLEGSSFRVGLSQTFTVPPVPLSLSFDLVALNLTTPEQGLPDAFEASLLDDALNALVDTTTPSGTAFFNANPNGVFSLANGVTFDGTNVTVDISGLAAGSEATIFFNIIGNENGVGASAVIDQVTTDPEVLFVDTFTPVPLAGPFVDTAGIAQCDVSGNSHPDIVVEDTGLDLFILYENDGAGNFNRLEFGPEDYGCPTTALFQAEATDVDSLVFRADEITPTVTFEPWLSRVIKDYARKYTPSWFVLNPNASTAINLDDVVSGSIDIAFESDEYTLNISTGKTVFMNVLSGSLSHFNWSLSDSATNVLDSSSIWTDGTPTPIQITGPHTLTVNGRTTALGSYSFELRDVPETVVVPAQLNTNVTGEIVVPGEVDRYSFTIAAPLDIYADAITGSLSAYKWSLTDPTGGVVFTTSNWNDAGIHTLTQSGTYVVDVDGSGDRTGNYTFGLFVIPSNAPIDIALDTVVDDSLDVQGETQAFTLPITAPLDIYADAITGSLSAYKWSLTDPTGGVVFTTSNWNDAGIHTLTQSGTYVVDVDGSGDRTGNFTFGLFVIPSNAPIDIALDTVVDDSLDVQGETQAFTLPITAPLQVYGNAISGSGSAFNWQLIDPTGSVVATRGSYTDLGLLDLSVSGDYTVLLDGNGDRTGPFTFEINAVPATTSTSITLDTVVTGEILKSGQQVFYEVDISGPMEIYADAITGSGSAFNWRLLDPSDNEIFSKGSFTDGGLLMLPTAGIYRIELDGNGDRTGPYTFSIEQVPQNPAQSFSLFEVVSDEILISGEIKTYTFEAEAGQTVYFRDLAGSASAFNWQMLGPTNAVLGSRSAFSDLNGIPITDTGTHTVIVDGNGDRTGPYTFSVVVVPQHPTEDLPLDAIKTGAITVSGETYQYTFDALAGETNTFEFIYNEANVARLQVLRPNGNNLFGNVSGSRTQVFTEDGTYTAIITSAANDPVPFSFRRIAGDTSTPLPASSDLVITSITSPGRVVQNPATLQFDWTVSNTGTVATAATTWKDRVWLAIVDDPSRLDYIPAEFSVSNGVLANLPETTLIEAGRVEHVGALAPGASYQQSFTLTFPDDYEGAFWVFIETDAENVEFEQTSELNNRQRANNLTGIYPNLSVASGDGTLDLNIANGDVFTAGQTITVSGLARSLPEVVNVYYVVDYSLSTANPTGLDANFDGQLNTLDDINGDNRIGDILDVELGAIRVINQLFVDQGVFANVAYVIFAGDAQRIDFNSAMLGQYFWDTVTDTDEDGITDFDEATLFIPTYFGTDFDFPNQALVDLIPIAPDAAVTEIFYFTDGEAGQPNTNLLNAIGAEGVNLHAFQIDGNAVNASLQAVADGIDAHPNSTAEAILVEDPNDLATSLIATLDIAGVAVNGRGVASLDAGGRFFTPITIQPGEQDIEVTAFDNEGNAFTKVVRVIGAPSPDSIEQFVEIDLQARLQFSNLSYNQQTRKLYAEARIMNFSDQNIKGPILAVFDNFVPGVVTVDAFDGLLADGRPYLVFDTEIPGGMLAPATFSEALSVTIADPEELRFDFNVTLLAEGNVPPFFTTVPVVEAVAGRVYSYTANADDANGDAILYTLLYGPSGMAIHTDSGAINWSPAASDQGVHRIEIHATDGRGGIAIQGFQLEVLDGSFNRPPIFQSSPPVQVASGGNFNYLPTTFDPDFDPLIYSLPTDPGATSFTSSTGEIILDAPPDGTYDFVLSVSDGAGATAQQAFTVTVGGAGGNNSGPTFLSIPSVVAAVDRTYTYLPLAEDPDGDLLSYTLLNGPTNMMYNTTNSLVTWTPTLSQVGAHPVQIRVDDPNGQFATQFYSIEVLSSPSNLPPAIISQPLDVATIQEPYTYNVVATDPEALALTFALDTGPSGMVMGAQSGELTWTPTTSDLGPHPVSVRAEDPAGAVGFQSFTLTVKGSNTPPIFVSSPITEAAEDARYTYTAVATDADDALTYALGNAPATMDIDATIGELSWTPGNLDLGMHDISVIATDERGLTAQQDYVLTVLPDTILPVVTVTRSHTLRQPGEAVTVTVTAVDNVGINTVSLTANDSPLSLDGNNQATFTTNDVALVVFTGTAIDVNGNVGTGSTDVRFYDAGDTNPPTLLITSPMNATMVSAPTNIVGSAFDADGAFDYYTMEYALASELEVINGVQLSLASGPFVEFHRGTAEVMNDVLGMFDPTILPNDDYVIRVTAWDINGQGTQEGLLLSVVGDLKLGQFRYDFVDLSMPIGGVPITITRSYDSFNAPRQGDFGFGWCLSIADADIKETIPDNGLGFFGANAFYDGVRVYVTNPDGDRVGFTFRLEPGLNSPYLGASFRPVFEADPGVFDTLEPLEPNINLGQQADGSAVLKGLPFPYNPNEYRLTTKDGTQYIYGQHTGLQQIIDPATNTVTFTETGLLHSSGVSIEFVRDAQGRITEIIDPEGASITYTYDAAGNLATSTDRDARTSTYSYYDDPVHFLYQYTDPSGNSPVTTEYDENGRLVAVTDANGDRNEFGYHPGSFTGTLRDSNGGLFELLYDVNGNLIRQLDPLGGITSYTFDDDNNTLTETDPNGNTVTMTYDTRGNMLSATDGETNTFFFAYDPFGNTTAITNPVGAVATWQYNDSGMMTGFINPEGAQATYTYNAQGNLDGLIDLSGGLHQFQYEGNNYPVRAINPDNSIREYTLNQLGRIGSVTIENGALLRYGYNGEGEATGRVNADGGTNLYTYVDGNETSRSDGLERITYSGYDGRDNLVAVTNPAGAVVSYAYDGNANRTNVTDAAGNTTTFVYDALNRLIESIDPHGNRATYAYDAAGNQVETVNRNGKRRTFVYDQANRMTHERWWEGTNMVREMTFVYDGAGNLTQAADPAATYNMLYDQVDRLLQVEKEAQPGESALFVLDYGYGPSGNVTSIVDNVDTRVEAQFPVWNRLGQLTWQGSDLGEARVDIAYDNCGCAKPTTLDRFSDLAGTQAAGSTSKMYDLASRVSEIIHRGPTGTVISSRQLSHNLAGEAEMITIDGQANTYQYDLGGQLTQSTRPVLGDELFSFDPAGNPTGTTYTVGIANQLLADAEYDYSYDAEGNVTQRLERATGNVDSYSYDHRNRLVEVERVSTGNPTEQYSLRYDCFDRLIRRDSSTGGIGREYVYDRDHIWAERTPGATGAEARYLYGNRLDRLVAIYRPADGLIWVHQDHLGSVVDLVDSAGTVLNHTDYDSFGRIQGHSTPSAASIFAFAGRPYDADLGLYNNRARYYDPTARRFISPDPLGFESDDANLYRYVQNRPLNYTDPMGTFSAGEYAELMCSIIGALQIGKDVATIFAIPVIEVANVIGGGSLSAGYSPPDPPTPPWEDPITIICEVLGAGL